MSTTADDDAPPQGRDPLSFATVVFDAEYDLLRLQGLSFDRFAPSDLVHAIIVIDNTVFGIGALRRGRIVRAFGRHAERVRFVRTNTLGVDRSADGWRSQQAAKLLIARTVDTPHYVVLDAKNHFVRSVRSDDFVGALGVPHGGEHPYVDHPLRSSLSRTLTAIGASGTEIEAAESRFPVTATPFVIETGMARDAVHDLEQRSGTSFARAFEEARMLEFFYYSGWVRIRHPDHPVSDGTPIQSPVVWGSAATDAGVASTLKLVRDHDAPVFSVHRRALLRLPRSGIRTLASFWAERGLIDERAALRLVAAFRLRYRPAMMLTRFAELARRGRRAEA